ncbi:hypothetical protein SSS_07419 [Sarcoptes scabiei]|nr:hypothetical protein SSS_07419 [Sarcoptes scabiei]
MFESFKLFLIFVAIIVLTINNLEIEADQEVDYFTTANSLGVEPERCDVCDLNNCPVPTTECLAGLVKDHCDCCFQCARREGERCFDERFKEKLPDDYERYPKCGDDLQCEIRTDLEENDRPEAICYCRYNDPICGSDGISYENQCQFTEARYRNRKLFEIDNRPCKSTKDYLSAGRYNQQHR